MGIRECAAPSGASSSQLLFCLEDSESTCAGPVGASTLTDASFEGDAKQLLRLHRELHRQLLEHLAAEAAYDHRHCVLGAQSPLLAVEDLVLADLRCRSLMLQSGSVILHLDVGEGVRATVVADQHRV